jgi:uncharacterized protein YukE
MLRGVTDRLEVDLPSLLHAAGAVDALGARTAGGVQERALRRVADAVPGGRLADAATDGATAWVRQAEQLRAALDAAADSLREAATTYRRTDDAAAAWVPTPAIGR